MPENKNSAKGSQRCTFELVSLGSLESFAAPEGFIEIERVFKINNQAQSSRRRELLRTIHSNRANGVKMKEREVRMHNTSYLSSLSQGDYVILLAKLYRSRQIVYVVEGNILNISPDIHFEGELRTLLSPTNGRIVSSHSGSSITIYDSLIFKAYKAR